MHFDRVIVADWSASSSIGPKKPSPDRCWIAWADAHDTPNRRPAPEYFRTRHDCEVRLASLSLEHPGSVLLAFDFAIGYPLSDEGTPVLPTGRGLLARVHEMVQDEPDATNNRFEVAAALNSDIRAHTHQEHAPFWGHPPGRAYPGLPFRKPAPDSHACREFRTVESILRSGGQLVQSPWKLAGAAAVGSQSLLGLPMLHRLLQAAGSRAVLWPFENVNTDSTDHAIVIAECWPSIADANAVEHPIKDARQVVAMRDFLLRAQSLAELLHVSHPAARTEGWILGVPG